jgi:SAM-dependent methyltransferase
MSVSKLDHKATYTRLTEDLQRQTGQKRGAELAIGGEFYAFGVVEREMLRYYGLMDDHYLIDVGCGSGRLSQILSKTHDGRYLGVDIVQDLVAHAEAHTNRPDWRFEVVDRIHIPEVDGVADMVCMFSLLTHLLHEQSYLYLEEAKRVLRPGGRIVISFLEFAMAFHWAVFANTVEGYRKQTDLPLNTFIERNVFACWAENLGLQVHDLQNGDRPFVPIPEPLTLDDGTVFRDFGNLGQSICVLKKP